jgi:archaellum component FlaC
MVDDSSASTSPPMENSSPIQSDTENLHKEIKELNTRMAQVVKYLKDTADNTDKTHRATKALSGNGF